MSHEIYKGDSNTRFVDYSFGNVKAKSIEIQENLYLTSVVNGNPVDGATITIPPRCTVVLIQNTSPYTFLKFIMPIKPVYGQVLIISSSVDITSLQLNGATFAQTAPTQLTASSPLRFIFAGSWFRM